MSKERDEKACKFAIEEMADSSELWSFQQGWDQALDSEAVKKLVEAMVTIRDTLGMVAQDKLDAKIYDLAKQALEEFNKAKSQGDGE